MNLTIKTKRTICRAVGFLLFVLMLGIVRGMDAGSIRFGAGAAWAIALEAAGIAALWKAGVLKWMR